MSKQNNIFHRLLLLFILLMISSCATSVRISSINCPDNLELFKLDRTAKNVKSFSVRRMGIGDRNYSLKDIFESEGVDCSKVSKVTFDIVQKPMDVLYSLFPSFSSRTIIVYYQ